MEELEDSVVIQTALKIILAAGDARTKANEALDALADRNYSSAHELIGLARQHILKAHEAQTGIIQAEAAGEHFEPCLMFNHAQDTLMTIMSEVNFAERLIGLFEAFFNDGKIHEVK
ncbi:PTS lactose/cellobiose transporter subunit IIA [Collinsella tanakaei]|uniref:PTS lactose/cellobiose transporter subunit IIA n=1 Tax=Collinsella tanakaei YIT 12063 TaxID=742742 RepID=G1WH65_9ACTN|nr:PTS lactose/cellobiose transporter subunit IIA [Collinsella tanakaei]EGX67084.1 hypothetical protein HMPREF9452_00786 [Collinsella tanakaei YIT 12063]